MDTIRVESPEDGICVLTLDRPDRLNAINLAMYEELDRHRLSKRARTDAPETD